MGVVLFLLPQKQKHSSLTMKVMGLIAITLAVCLLTTSAQPLFLAPGVTAAFTAAGGLVFTQTTASATVAAGTVLATIPTGTLLLGKGLLAGKLLLAKAYLDERA